MAEEIGNSELVRTWASDGTIVVPSNAKVDEGWLRGEQPPHEWMNYIHNVLGQKINHVLSRGAADWDNDTEYLAGAIVNVNDDLWLALATNSSSVPSDSNSNWYRITAHNKDFIVRSMTLGFGEGGIDSNTVLGFDSLNNNTTGSNNCALGRSALRDNTTGTGNTVFGRSALIANTVGVQNAVVGVEALRGNTTGSNNTVVGTEALRSNTTGDENVAVGFDSLRNSTADFTVAVGANTMRANTTGEGNVAVGRNALLSNTTGINNNGIGRSALRDNTIGQDNVAHGRNALLINTQGNGNTAIGTEALFGNITGVNNTGIGIEALFNNTTGGRNTAVGINSLRETTTGSNNVGIGNDAGNFDSPLKVTDEDNRIVVGNNDHTNAYINVSWTVTSDARDKAEFASVPHGLDFVNGLQPTQYQLKTGGREGQADGKIRYGFLAQDVLALEGGEPVIADNEEPDKLKLNESQLIPVLVQAIQELTARVAELESNNG